MINDNTTGYLYSAVHRSITALTIYEQKEKREYKQNFNIKKHYWVKRKVFKCFLNISMFVICLGKDKVFQADEAAIVNRLSTETKWDLSCAEWIAIY